MRRQPPVPAFPNRPLTGFGSPGEPTRPLIALLLLPLVGSAQDMPLFTFTVEGEGWVKADGKKPQGPDTLIESTVGKSVYIPETGRTRTTYTFDYGKVSYRLDFEGKTVFVDGMKRAAEGCPSAIAMSADKSTLFVGHTHQAAVWAFVIGKDSELTHGAPYAPLRIRNAYDNSPMAREKLQANPPTLAVTDLVLDSAGRLYVATERDLQVFDPTGRLSGVLALPDKGKVDRMAWEENVLVAWVGEQKWTRKMKP